MKKTACLILAALLALAFCAEGGFALMLGGKELAKIGTGRRTMTLIGTVYFATLYAPEALKGKDGTNILEADEPMSVAMLIDSGLLSKDRFVKAIREGFVKAAGSGYATDKVDTFLKLFDGLEMKKGDTITLSYLPRTGISASISPKGGAAKAWAPSRGLAFKKALFAIWLGPNPVQENLKKGMLGR